MAICFNVPSTPVSHSPEMGFRSIEAWSQGVFFFFFFFFFPGLLCNCITTVTWSFGNQRLQCFIQLAAVFDIERTKITRFFFFFFFLIGVFWQYRNLFEKNGGFLKHHRADSQLTGCFSPGSAWSTLTPRITVLRAATVQRSFTTGAGGWCYSWFQGVPGCRKNRFKMDGWFWLSSNHQQSVFGIVLPSAATSSALKHWNGALVSFTPSHCD